MPDLVTLRAAAADDDDDNDAGAGGGRGGGDGDNSEDDHDDYGQQFEQTNNFHLECLFFFGKQRRVLLCKSEHEI